MKFLKFNFNHPFKGKASLTQLFVVDPQIKGFVLDSKLSNLVEVPLHTCAAGKWRITLNWDHEGRLFTHEQDFEIGAPQT